jgi:tetratricopeptide (TPR) repeat protein
MNAKGCRTAALFWSGRAWRKKMSTTETGDKFIGEFNIDSAIGAFTVTIDKTKKEQQYPAFKDYLGRGIARCFNPVKKDEKYADAIADLSAAIALDNNNVEALYYRAYAYYMNKLYDRAKADCEKIQDILKGTDNIANISVCELLGLIYGDRKDYLKAAENYRQAITPLLKRKIDDLRIIPPSLFDNYRKVCEKMREDD